MKVSAQWLNEWVSPAMPNSALAERLTMAGLEVDSIEPAASPMRGISVARVLESVPHENADKLSRCRVDIGDGKVVDVVCGASNVRSGLSVAYAAPGAQLPDGRIIEHAVIRDVAFAGMLCSATELELGEDGSGLLELADDAPIGTPIEEFLQLDDEVFDIELTPNRGDCLSIVGVAREIAALTDTPMREIAIPCVPASIDDACSIVIDAPQGCPRYAGRVIRNVNAAVPTPMWIRERLRRCGIRSISAVVDVTNYVMLELGQPMHGFDLDQLNGGIHIRNGRAGESLELLDGETIELDTETLVIADHDQAVALAGVMGGMRTGVATHTTSIFLESAYFDAITLAGVARRYRLHTDASHRFERGVDFAGQERALERASALIMDICGGDPGPLCVSEVMATIPARNAIVFRPSEIQHRIGVEIAAESAVQILESLRCEVEKHDDHFEVTPPSFRFDLELEVDLLEEVARLYGYDNIPSTLPATTLSLVRGSDRYERDERIRDFLIAQGYFEAITYSFIEPSAARMVAPDRGALVLSNPITSEMSVMRTSIWAGLINAALHNLNRQVDDVRLFELGMIFEQASDVLEQRHVLAGLAVGKVRREQWGEASRNIDFFDVKQELENLFDTLSVPARRWSPGTDCALHPGQSAIVDIGGTVLGKVGVLHPELQRHFGLAHGAVLFEIELDKLPPGAAAIYAPISKFPSVRRDISVIVDRRFAATALLDAIRHAAGDQLRDLQLFDEYQGQGIDAGKKSLTMGLIFQAHSSTLRDEEVEETMKRVLSQLHDDFGGTLRN